MAILIIVPNLVNQEDIVDADLIMDTVETAIDANEKSTEALNIMNSLTAQATIVSHDTPASVVVTTIAGNNKRLDFSIPEALPPLTFKNGLLLSTIPIISGSFSFPFSNFNRIPVVNESFTLLISGNVSLIGRSWLANCNITNVSGSNAQVTIISIVETTGQTGSISKNTVNYTELKDSIDSILQNNEILFLEYIPSSSRAINVYQRAASSDVSTNFSSTNVQLNGKHRFYFYGYSGYYFFKGHNATYKVDFNLSVWNSSTVNIRCLPFNDTTNGTASSTLIKACGQDYSVSDLNDEFIIYYI